MEITLPASKVADTSNPHIFLKQISTDGNVNTIDVYISHNHGTERSGSGLDRHNTRSSYQLYTNESLDAGLRYTRYWQG